MTAPLVFMDTETTGLSLDDDIMLTGIDVGFPHGDKHTDPVGYANAQTSYHDARAALCFTTGATVDQVDPCTGHDRRGVR